ncbi:hypothetical protein D3869_30355 (plasmid) [Azospirillum brasilense]|uniref:PIN domain-containing protein n=1 Tax=Azospirillum brasilense TaxID=192 RepID=A0A4D8RE28_AZOBR|nr:PIN domain nuclease [Azospirillum brasilense]QCO19540.1 hypothetical protein D3869_30355 [Azospirillum brasilense]
MEVPQGVRDEAVARRVEQALRTHAVQAMLSPTAAPKVAANHRALRAKGITVRKTIDMVIGTFCMEGGHVLLHNDEDFEPMRQHLGLRVLQPEISSAAAGRQSRGARRLCTPFCTSAQHLCAGAGGR